MKHLKCIFLLFWAVQITTFAQTPCDDVNTALLKIDKLIVDGKLDQALDALKKIKNDPNVRNCDNMKVVEYKIKDIESKMLESLTAGQLYNLGNDYYYGRNGKDKDYAKAAEFYRKAAEMGAAYAQNMLGWLYDKGYGVEQNYVEAVKWYRKAAEQSYAEAQFRLGYLYENGYGVSKSISEAKKWYEKAAAQGNEFSKERLKVLTTNTYDCPDDNHPHAIDLGLPSGTKWACCNVGADSPEAYGGYYAWGETETKTKYDWKTYAYGTINTCRNIGSDIAGTQYDVAYVKWGGSWVMPSLDQIKELLDSCTSQWTTMNGVKGRIFTGPSGRTIFLPAAGFPPREGHDGNVGSNGYYWSSTQRPSYARDAYGINLYSKEALWCAGSREEGNSVRPVSR